MEGKATLTLTDAKSGRGVNGFVPAIRELLRDKLKEYEAKGYSTRRCTQCSTVLISPIL